MLKRGERYDAAVRGRRDSAPIRRDNLERLAVRGSVLRGAIRQLCFDADGSLLLLAGRGVRRLDADTLEQTGSWLSDRVVDQVLGPGPTLWVVCEGALHRAAFGAPLGEPLVTLASTRGTIAADAGQLAAVTERGVVLVGTDGSERRFTIDPEWYAALWSPNPPDIALLSPSGRTIGASRDGRYVVLWDVATGAVIHQQQHRHASVLLDDDRYLSMGTFSSDLHLFRTDGHQGVASPDSAAAVVTGEEILVGSPQGEVCLLRRADLSTIRRLEGHPKEYGSSTSLVCIARSQRHIATYAVMTGVLRVFSDAGLVEQRGWSGSPEGLSVSDDGQRALVGRDWGGGRADVIDVGGGTLQEVRGPGGLICPGLTPDGESVVLPCGSNLRGRAVHVASFDGSQEQEVHTIRAFARGFIGFGGDCYALLSYTLSSSGEIVLQRAGVKRAIAKVKLNKESPWTFAIGQGGAELAVGWEREIIRYDLTKRPKPVQTIPRRAISLALGPVGHLAYIWYDSGAPRLTIQRPGAADLELPLDREARYRGSTPRLAFGTDGALLLVGRTDGVLEVRSTVDGAVLRCLPLVAEGFVAMAFAAEALWVMGADGQVLILGVDGEDAADL